jgi:hypothetical protein
LAGDVDYDGLSRPARDLLSESGWSFDRRVDVTAETALLRGRHVVSPVVEDFLGRFSGLTVRVPSAVPRRKDRVFHFNVDEASVRSDGPLVDSWEDPADDYLCLVGHLTNGNMALVMSSAGAMYAGKGSGIFRLGSDPVEGLNTLCSRVPVEEWPRQRSPQRVGPPLLLKATPPAPAPDAAAAANQALKVSYINDGPVLGCVDFGDVWRVFRSRSTHILAAPQIPLLVDKRTGDVFNDWPFRRGGPTAHDAFKQVLREVAPHLRERGFQGSGTGWRRDDGDRYVGLSFVRFRSGSAVASTFYLTVSVISTARWEQLRGQDPGLPSKPPAPGDNGTRVEYGEHNGMPVAFHVLAGTENEWMAQCVLDTIEARIGSQA